MPAPAWLPALSLASAGLCAAGWWTRAVDPAWLLPLGLLPAAIRLATARRPFARSGLEYPLALFALTAGLGVWAAYDRSQAWVKFWNLLGGLLLFAALAEQPRRHLPRLALLLALFGAGLAGHFLLTHDWRQHPADIGSLSRLGWWWQAWRPRLAAAPLPPNVAGGLLAMLAPFGLASLSHAWQARRRGEAAAAALALLVMGLGLALSSSRAAWLALAAALAFWAAARAACAHVPVSLLTRRRLGLVGAVVGGLVLVGLAAAVAWRGPAGLVALTNALPGLDSGASRLELFANTYRLAQAFPLTGGGLAAFAGLYSRYMLGIPVLMFSYSHNLYLDVMLEQGLLGALALLSILAASGWRLARYLAHAPRDGLAWATLASLGVLALHGLADDPAYAGTGSPLLFLAPGLAVAVARQALPAAPRAARTWRRNLPQAAGAALVVGGLALGLPLALRGVLFTNLGAVAMARQELSGWQDGAVNDWGEVQIDSLQWLERAVSLAPQLRPAHYRLGLLALEAGQFEQAAAHLAMAHAIDPGHRGASKALGYTYLWLGQPDRAWPLLAAMPEARKELRYYARWWAQRGRPELAARAASTAAYLAHWRHE